MQTPDPNPIDTADKIFHIVVAAGAIAAAWMGLLIRNALQKIALTQAANKAEMLAEQVAVKEDLQQKHAENRQQLAIHMAEDVIQFRGLTDTGVRMEAKLDKLVDRIVNGRH